MMNCIKTLNISRLLTLIVVSLAFSNSVFAQGVQYNDSGKEITGVVRSANGTPVGQAVITLKGQTVSATTNDSGEYSIVATTGDLLVCQKEGYWPVEKTIDSNDKVDFTLEILMSNKKNVAFGELPLRNINGAFTEMDSKTVKRNSISQIEQAMNGSLSGLYSFKNGGKKFGASNYDFFVRGKSTTGSNLPLVLVDGLEGNIDLLDPSQIENITVLKDASELAMYGMRGSNGVILVETKKGDSANSFLNVDARVGVQSPVATGEKLNAYQYATLHNEANVNDGNNPIYSPDNYLGSEDPYRFPQTRFEKDFLKDQSVYQQYNFSSGGGNDVARYYTMVGYTKQDGLFDLPDGYSGLNQTYQERYNFRTNLDVDLGKGFTMNTGIAAVYSERRSPWTSTSDVVPEANDLVFNTLMQLPANAFPLVNPDGSLGGTSEYRNNPLGMLTSGSRREDTRMLSAKVRMTKNLDQLLNGLDVFAVYGFENYNAYYKGRYTSFGVYQWEADSTYTLYGADDTKVSTAGGQIPNFYSDRTFITGANYNQSFGKHDLRSTLVYNQYSSRLSGDRPQFKWAGTSFRLAYAFDNKFYAQITSAYQGSNSFSEGNRYGFFPAASLGWVVSEEDFLKAGSLISYLKLRGSYGLSGNDRTMGERFMYRQAYYIGGGYGFGIPNGSAPGSYEGTLENPSATWEKSYQTNVGVDLSLLKNSVFIKVDYFHESRKDILVDQANVTPSLIGISLPQFNAGEISNQGIDSEVLAKFDINGLKITAGANLLLAENNVKDLKEIAYPDNEQYRLRQGNPLTARFGLVADGLYGSQEDINQHGVASAYGTLKPGDIKYVDQNGDGLIDESDRTVIGNTFPEFIYGFHLGLDFKRIDFSLYGEGSGKYEIHSRPNQFSEHAFENRWTANNGSVTDTYPRLSLESDHNFQTSTFWQEKGRYFRINSIELGYSLPEKWVRKAGVSGLRVYGHAQNAFSTKTSKEGRDYEALSAGFTQYPFFKTYLFGLTVNL